MYNTLSMLRDIAFCFPTHSPPEREFFDSLLTLLQQLPSAHKSEKGLTFVPSFPTGALPTTSVQSCKQQFPHIIFHPMPELHIEVNNFTLGTSPPVHYVPSPTKCTVTPARDAVGKYMIVQTNNFTFYQLTMTELTRRLHGHITRIDHTGIVVPYDVVSKDLWKNAIDLISEHSNLYDYPTGANWPFIIPATTAEFANDISEFRIGREPKFELVRDDMGGVPLIQFAIETDLTKEQAITLFPDPVGCELGDLGDYFRSLYIVHPWIGLTLRFDLYYRDDSTSIYYESGEWFVKEGGRVR